MKTILLSFAASFTFFTATAQYSQNFNGTEASLTGNCWTLVDVHTTTNAANVIAGTGSMLTDPPTSSLTRDLITPALNISSTSLNISFSYKLTNTMNSSSSRFIQVGLLDPAGSFTLLHTINLNSSTPTTVFNFNQTFTLTSTGWRKIAIRAGGSGGPGNSRLVFDDFSTNANPLYGSGTCNGAPVANNDVFNGIAGMPVTGNVMFNDTDPNGESMQAAVVASSPDGVLVLNTNGSFVFTPNTSFAGPLTTFTYQLTDNGFNPVVSNVATVVINIAAAIPLPVKLVSFNATLNASNDVNLTWTTASEKNVSHFEVETSVDGRDYKKAGIVFAYGNTKETIDYAFTDKKIDTRSGVVYYRLRSVDIDGTSELSNVRSIRFSKTAERSINIVTYPNPVVNEVRVTIPSSWQGKKVTYVIYNSNGLTVLKNTVLSGSQTEAFNIGAMVPGLYVVKAICNGETAEQKIIKR